MSDWWLDEVSHAGAEHLDPSYVDGYDTKAGYDPTDDIAALELVGLSPNSIVIDLGAGTGTFAIAAAKRCGHVIAIDVSAAMAEAIRRRSAADGVHNLTVVQAGFVSYDHCGAPADIVFSRNALHHLPDFWKAIAVTRIHAMLRPGGILRLRDLIFDFDPANAQHALDAWLNGASPDPAGGYTADELRAHVREEFSTYRWIIEAMLDHAGFQILTCDYRRSVYGTYTCRRR